jgi:SAM-dependent methyltransferase
MMTTTQRGEKSSAASLRPSAALHWPLDSLTNNRAWQQDDYWINERAKHRRFSFRMLRYWYMERLLRETREQLGRPLRVLEIGVDRGQMKAFVDGAPADVNADSLYSAWDAADVKPQTEALTRAGYAECLALNLDDGDSLAEFVSRTRGQYDVVILLHVLEHLTQPERAVTFLSGSLAGNGRMLGGFPVLPSGIARIRERQIRKTAQPFGHVSAFSPRRVRKMAERAGMLTDYASGAFAVRASGSPLENSEWWLRANVAFGALFPGWPGEIYFQLRKPAQRGGAPVLKDQATHAYAAAD